eukprot:COSAG05_NODE_210_length_14015_cov_3.851785_12_plen_68_part_00
MGVHSPAIVCVWCMCATECNVIDESINTLFTMTSYIQECAQMHLMLMHHHPYRGANSEFCFWSDFGV